MAAILVIEDEQRIRESLATRKKLLGEDHPHVATSLNNIAGTLNDQGKYAEAEAIHRESLAMRKKLLGAEHPSVREVATA